MKTVFSHISTSILSSAIFGAATLSTACADHTVVTAPSLSVATNDTAAVADAHDLFWEAFEGQRHGELDRVRNELRQALLDDPNDPDSTLLLAHSYLWSVLEWQRVPGASEADLGQWAADAERYFLKAQELNPDDLRIGGWLGPTLAGNGSAANDGVKLARGLRLVEDGVTGYPTFYLFVQSLSVDGSPRDSEAFRSGVDGLWRTLDLCANQPLDRQTPDLRVTLETSFAQGADPACANTEKAAHNFEGFMLYTGDVLTKFGAMDAARAVYSAAEDSPDFSTWPYGDLLAQRKAELASNVLQFANTDPSDDPLLVSQTEFACGYCPRYESLMRLGRVLLDWRDRPLRNSPPRTERTNLDAAVGQDRGLPPVPSNLRPEQHGSRSLENGIKWCRAG